jgi:cytochrome P450
MTGASQDRAGVSPADDLFADYDHVARLCLEEDPLPLLKRMRESCPVGRSEMHGGSWVLTRYQDIYDVTRDTQTFCSGQGVSFPAHGMPPLPPIETDPPVHALFRGPLTTRFTTRAIADNEDHAREVVTGLIDTFIEDGSADLAQQLTVPLPALVNTPVLGIPFDDRAKFQDWAVRLLSSAGQDLEAILSTAAYFSELYRIRRERPQDDIPTLMTQVELEGEPITPETFVLVMVMLMSAGLDTTTNAGSHILHWLAQHPRQRQELVDDPERIPAAVEELLRHITPLPTLFRTTTRAVTLHDRSIPEGDVNGQVEVAAGGQVEVPASRVCSAWFSLSSCSGSGLFHAVGVAVGDDGVAVVQEPVEQADRGGVLRQEPAPGLERPVAADPEGAAFVGGGDEPEQQLCSGVIQWREPELVADDQVVAQMVVDDPADGVVGQGPVEGLDQISGGEVADPIARLNGRDPEGDQDVGLPGAGRPDQAGVLGCPDPLERGQVVERRLRDRGGCDVELGQRLGHRERGRAHPVAGVGGVPGGDLGLDEGAQELLRGPALGLRGDQQLRGELAHRGELEPAQPVDQVGGQRGWGRGHDELPTAALPVPPTAGASMA